MTYISPSTKRFHDDIVANSPSRVRHHNAESLRASRKIMISIIDYIISIREIEDDPQSAIMFDEMEKTLQKFKLELQHRKLTQPKTPPRKGMIEFPAFNGPKKNQNQDLRDLEDSCYVLTNLYIRINHMGNTNYYINSNTYERNCIVPNVRINTY
jgi:hypothetical protein